MWIRTAALAVLAGLSAFLVVGVAATELGTAAGIEFSLFVGIPAGLVAAVAAAAFLFVRYDDPDPARRRPAVLLGGFGVAFVAALLLGVGGLGLMNSVALPVAAAVGAAGAVVALRIEPRV